MSKDDIEKSSDEKLHKKKYAVAHYSDIHERIELEAFASVCTMMGHCIAGIRAAANLTNPSWN